MGNASGKKNDDGNPLQESNDLVDKFNKANTAGIKMSYVQLGNYTDGTDNKTYYGIKGSNKQYFQQYKKLNTDEE